MSDALNNTEDLRRAFRERPADDTPRGPCPPAERLREAALDLCAPQEWREILDHTTVCPACATGWRLAREIGKPEARAAEARERPPWLPRWAAAAAAILLVAVAAAYLPRLLRQPGEPVFRSGGASTIQSEIEDGSTLPRDRFLLRWSSNLEDAIYRVRVLDQDLNPLASAGQLTGTEFQVSEQALEALDAGQVVLWRVEARRPGGKPVMSPTFSVKIE